MTFNTCRVPMESFCFGQSIRALLSDLWRIEDEEITLACADGYLWRLEACLREILPMESLGLLEQHCSSGVVSFEVYF